MTYKKKLIEVALPLDAINRESAREKFIRHGHPSTLHLWWARRPLAAARAVLWASLVDDPSAHPTHFPTQEAQEKERKRLLRLLGEIITTKKRGKATREVVGLVSWNDIHDKPEVVQAAQREIARSLAWERGEDPPTDLEAISDYLIKHAPPALDPFCGGGTIPLEAQRMGLKAYAGDLNPVATLITKALIEIPPKFTGRRPMNPESVNKLDHGRSWIGAAGLAEDVRYYGRWLREEAITRVGHLYPKLTLPMRYGGGEGQVLAWIWARTVNCPDPSCEVEMPLIKSFVLSRKAGEQIWAQPFVRNGSKKIHVKIKEGDGNVPPGTVTRRGATCLVCGNPVPLEYIRKQGRSGRMSRMLLAIVAEVDGKRIYLPPTQEHEAIAVGTNPDWIPKTNLPKQALGFRVQLYGMTRHSDLFTPRQLTTLSTLSGLVPDLPRRVLDDFARPPTHAQGATKWTTSEKKAYANAVATYIAFSLDKTIARNNTLCPWEPGMGRLASAFGMQTVSMKWDYAETNPFAGAGGDFLGSVKSLCEVLDKLPAKGTGQVEQLDSRTIDIEPGAFLISTDPPYYDNIGYADLSDFFYVWLRHSIGDIYPDLFSTVLTPKLGELIASPGRFEGDSKKAKDFFEEGLRQAFQQIHRLSCRAFPVTIFYAFKQTESREGADETGSSEYVSTGWEAMLEALLGSGLGISATWPIRTEQPKRMRDKGVNALASSIVLACRTRPADAPMATRSEFLAALRRELPGAVRLLQTENIAPVDLAQSAIGPGMAVFSRFSKVVEADGSAMKVRTALRLINEALQEVLSEEETEFDGDTRWALTWFEQHGMNPGRYGDAETLSKAKDTSVSGVVTAGIVESHDGKVRLLDREELDPNWDPSTDRRLTVWEVTQHLIQRLDMSEVDAAELLRQIGPGYGERARQLAYLLYGTCERKSWAKEAVAYNGLIVSWPELARLAAASPGAPVQQTLGDEEWQ